MHNELTKKDIQMMKEELDYRRIQLRPQLLDGDGLQPAHRGALELFQGAEGPEVVGAAQIFGGQAHGRHVQGLLDVV